jgi:hypothetical protein
VSYARVVSHCNCHSNHFRQFYFLFAFISIKFCASVSLVSALERLRRFTVLDVNGAIQKVALYCVADLSASPVSYVPICNVPSYVSQVRVSNIQRLYTLY